MDILQIECRIFSWGNKKINEKNPCTENDISFEINKILSSKSPFVQVCKKFCEEKALSNYFKGQNFYLEPVEKVVRFDHEKGKPDSLQYVPILSTLKVLLQHEDVLGHIYENPICQGNTMSNYSRGSLFKKNKLLATVPNCSEIILYHDDFGVSNPLRNKFKKYKMPAFYFVLGNIPGKYRSRLKDVQLTLLFPSELTQKYRYHVLIEPLLDDIKVLESTGLYVKFEGKCQIFRGTVTMLVAAAQSRSSCLGWFLLQF